MNLPTRILHTLAGELYERSEMATNDGEPEIARWLEFSGQVAGALAKTLAKHDAEIENDDPDHP